MRYVVNQDFLLNEGKQRQLSAGQTLQDGDLEPDVMAQLVSQGTVVAEGAQLPDPEAEWSEDDGAEAMTLPEHEMPDEPPSRRTRGGRG